MYETKHLSTAATLKEGGDEAGHLEAVISTFGVVDGDGDVVEATAFTPGQSVPLVWSHDWNKPIGKGTIGVTDKHAIFSGRFFMDTQAGQEAYRTVKAMGDLQEYSWGFRVLDSDFAERDGQDVRVIKRTEMYEASPTLVGANRQTGTLSIKSDIALKDQEQRLLADAVEVGRRYGELVALEAKRGRALSQARIDRINATIAALGTVQAATAGQIDDLRALLAEADPPSAEDGKAAEMALLDFLAHEARRLGVAV